MKKILSFALVVVMLFSTTALSGCDAVKDFLSSITLSDSNNSIDSPSEHNVTFVYNNGMANTSVTIENGKTVPTPADPEKTNYLFRGWYTDRALTKRYDFAQPVTKTLRLYAKYEIDATTLTNTISTDTIKGIVKIYNKSYNTFLGIETSYSTSQGSGFCFHIQNGNYYVLTNCHVAMKDASYDKQEFTIEDYQGKTYEGYLYKSPNKTMNAIAASYDLACLYFEASSSNVKTLKILSKNPASGADVISLGAPNGQSNTITFGQIAGYGKVTLSDTSTTLSNVTFDVIQHSAYINKGSSGGPLLDADLNVVGVNYAGSLSSNHGFAIPAEKVAEFLKEYVYN